MNWFFFAKKNNAHLFQENPYNTLCCKPQPTNSLCVSYMCWWMNSNKGQYVLVDESDWLKYKIQASLGWMKKE